MQPHGLPQISSFLNVYRNHQERGAHSQVQLALKVSFKKVGLFLCTQVGKFSFSDDFHCDVFCLREELQVFLSHQSYKNNINIAKSSTDTTQK